MFKSRNLVAVGLAVVMLILMTTWASAQPVQQGTVTPEATTAPGGTPVPTVSTSTTLTPTQIATAVAPAVSPLATPIGTPSTLPTTGGSDDGSAALSLLLIAAGAVILISLVGLTMSRRPR